MLCHYSNVTNHTVIPSPGYIGYIEVPVTNNKPPNYKVYDFNSSIQTIFHSYYSDLSEPKPPVRRSFLKKANIGINNLQASQFLNRPLPSPTYSPNTQHFVMKYKFQYPDVTDEEYLKLCVISVKYQHCYATHRNDVGKIASSFRIRLKPNAKLQTQKPTKIPIHY